VQRLSLRLVSRRPTDQLIFKCDADAITHVDDWNFLVRAAVP
jgi:hypothetical protein